MIALVPAWAFLPALFAWVSPAVIWGVRLIMVSVVIRFIVGLGVALAVFVGLEFFVDETRTYIANEFAGLPADLVGFVGLLELDTACTIILGAYSWRAAFMALKQFRIVRT